LNKIPARKVSFLLPQNVWQSVEELALRRHISPSELIRQFITKELSVEATKADMDEIRSHIRAELEGYLQPQIERLVKIMVKTGISASAGYYLTAKALSSFVPAHLQTEFEVALMESKKLGIAHMRVTDAKLAEYMAENEQRLNRKV